MTAQTTPRHRVSVATAQLREIATEIADASVWSMDAPETAATLVELTRLAAQVSELQARVAAHADDLHVGGDVGSSSTAAWLAHQTRATRAEAHRVVRLGHDLAAHPATRDALAQGAVVADQARVILRWVDDLPDTLDRDLIEKAERHLLKQAREFDAKALNRLGRRVFEVIAPDEADAREAATLAKEEAAAARACHLTMVDDGHGKTHGRFTLPTVHAAALRKMLTAIAAPKHQAATHQAATHQAATHKAATRGPGAERVTGPEALGRAFGELIERYPANRLPKTGGVSATLVVLIAEDSLLGRIEQAGTLDTGERISPALARRLACEAGIIPVVLDGAGQPLDIGRRRRLYTDYQRTALLVRDRGCAAEGCDRTTGLHAHHRHPMDRRRPDEPRPGRRPVPLAPQPRPRPPLRHHLPPHRHRPVPPTHVTDGQASRGAYMITATPTRQTSAPTTSYRSGRKPSTTTPHASEPATKMPP